MGNLRKVMTVLPARPMIRFNRHVSALSLWLGVGFGLGVFYVLSVGPAVWLSERKVVPAKFVTSINRPLRDLDGTPIQRLLNAYVRFWAPAPFEGDFPNH